MCNNDLDQACTTYGPRSKYGPRKPLIWPAKQKFLQIKLVNLAETPFEWINICLFWPLYISKKKFAPPRDLSCAPLI